MNIQLINIKKAAPAMACALLLVFAAGKSQAVVEEQTNLTELSIENLMELRVQTVSGASKFEQKVGEAPSSVSIITADDIRKYGYRTLADILKGQRSFNVTYDRDYARVGMRGFNLPGDYNSRILILLDGHRANDNILNQAFVGTDFVLDVDLISKIEIIRGPSSSIYGTSAFFAVINIITKNAKELKRVEASGEAESYGTYKGRLSLGNNFKNGPELLFSGSYRDSKGQQSLYYKEFDTPSSNNGIAQNCDYDRNYNLFSKVSYDHFTLEGTLSSRTKGVPTAYYGSIFNDSRNQNVDERGYLDLKYENKLGENAQIMARFYYDHYKLDSSVPHDYPPVTINKFIARGEWWGGELQAATTFYKNKLIGGIEYEANIKQNQNVHDIDPYFGYLDDKRTSSRWALYAQDEIAVTSNLILNAGIRYDRYSDVGGSVNPRFALIYNPLETMTLKALYGTAFRVPNVFERYFSDGNLTTKTNHDLKPEHIRTYELVLEQKLVENLRLSASGFHNEIKDQIAMETDPADGLLVYRNRGAFTANGIELELENTWKNDLKARISYSYQEVTNDNTHEWVPNSPKHQLKFNLTIPVLQDRIFAGLEEQYTSTRKTLAGNRAGDFFITNLTLFSQKLVPGLELSGNVYNLFDKKYGDPGFKEFVQDVIEQDGRTFRIKLTYRF